MKLTSEFLHHIMILQHMLIVRDITLFDYRFTHCYVGNVGSVHDQRVFRLSELQNYINDEQQFPRNSHMLGDAAYALNEHLLTPYKDNTRIKLDHRKSVWLVKRTF